MEARASGDEKPVFVHDEGDLRKYRTETPNMVLDMGLDPYTGWLYTHIKRIAGDRGVCDGGTRSLARIAGMSPGKVSECKGILKEKGLIRVVEHPRQSGLSDEIYVVNIWRRNFEHFDAAVDAAGARRMADRGRPEEPAEPRSQDEHPPVHVVNAARTACSCGEHPCSCGEHKKERISTSKETSPSGDAKKPPASSSTQGTRKRIKRLTDEEAERRWEELCGSDPHGGDLGKLAELLAAENSTGAVAITKVWNDLVERFVKTRERHPGISEEAWAYGFDRAIARPAPNIGYVLKAAKGHVPEKRPVGAGAGKGVEDGADRRDSAGYTKDYEFLFGED